MQKITIKQKVKENLRLLLLVSNAFFVLTSCNDDSKDTDVAIEIESSDFQQNSYDTNFTSEHFSGSGTCAACHNGITDSNNNDLSIVRDWSSSMMANAAIDPLWKAKVESELNRNPDLKGIIVDKCTRCHMPMAHIEASSSNSSLELFHDGFLDPTNEFHDQAMEGVSCTLCHQISDTEELGSDEGASGHFVINEQRDVYGPYQNILTQPMVNNVNFYPEYGPHLSRSKVCATCHDLKTPFVDTDGNIVEGQTFAEQTPYSEWQASDFSDTGKTPQQCHECHMPQINDGAVKISNRPRNGILSRDNFSQHLFLGANTYMLDIFKINSTALNTNSTNFDVEIARDREFLTTSGTIEIIDGVIVDETLLINVKVTNSIGHKLPTSYPSRRAYLHVKAYDEENNLVFESGKTLSNGAIEGNDADNDRSIFEPHYQTINSPEQVQIYETVMGNTENNVTYTLLEAAKYLKDNRLLPLGFNKATASEDIAVYGTAVDDSDFIAGQDTLAYQIDVSQLNSTQFTVTIDLNYQPVAYSFLQDLFTDDSIAVNRFKDYDKRVQNRFENIAQDKVVVSR